MLQITTPFTLFQEQIAVLRAQLPGMLDARPDSIHDARIATRRVREVLPLTHEWQRSHAADDQFIRFKRMGRSLGRVRDADVRIELINYLESRVPPAAATLALVRHHQQGTRLLLMRRLVKRVERLAVERELARLAGGAWHRARFWTALTGSWRSQLRHLVAERAGAAGEAIAHATGVYFPKRTHEARIAIKKFRYAAEVAARTGVMADDGVIRELKKSQDLLGHLHDRQTLIDELKQCAAHGIGIDDAQISLVVQVAQGEIADLHGRFLKRRPQVLDCSGRAVRGLDRGALTKGACAVAGVVVVAAGIEARRRYLPPRQRALGADAVGGAVSVRVPVALPEMRTFR